MKRETTEQEARDLLNKIQSYWASKGYLVQGEIEPVGYCERLRSTVYEIHTDLHNGFPVHNAR